MQGKLGKVWEKVLASMLLVLLTSCNLLVIGNSMVAYGLENVEGQNERTTEANVEFGAYLESEGNQVHSLICDVKEREILYIHLNVKEAGYIKEGKIELEGANYNVVGKVEESAIIGKQEENVLELKQINNGTDATIEVPIEAIKEEEYNIENISKESKVKFNGTYVRNNGKEAKIEKEVVINVEWKGISEIEAKREVKAYIVNEEETILQEKIEIKKANESMPIKKTSIEIEAPVLGEIEAEEVKVISAKTGMTNGKEKEEVEVKAEYDKENGKVIIEAENEEELGKVYAGNGKKDEYIITYTYEGKVEEVEIESKGKIEVETYGEDEKTKKEIELKENLLEEKGSLLGIEIEGKEINKAKIYANYNKEEKDYETEYEIKEIIEIGKAEGIKGIEIEDKEENYVDEEGNRYSTRVGEASDTEYKETRIEKENFESILGEEGNIIIETEEGEELGRIDKSIAEEEGKYVVKYGENKGRIVIKTSKPEREGILILEHEKVIKGELSYSKAEVESFKILEEIVEIIETDTERKEETKGEQNLTEAVSHLNIESSKTTITEAGEEVELKVELGNSEEDSVLYSNPEVIVTFPEFVKEVEVTNTNILFDEELETKGSEVIEKDGKKAIKVNLEGEQTDFNTIGAGNGTTLILGAKLTSNVEETQEEGEVEVEIEENRAVTKMTALRSMLTTGVEEPIETEEKEDESTTSESYSMQTYLCKEKMDEHTYVRVQYNNGSKYVKEEDTIEYNLRVAGPSDPNYNEVSNILVKHKIPEEFEFVGVEPSQNITNIEDCINYDEKTKELVWKFDNNGIPSEIKIKVKAKQLQNELQKDVDIDIVLTYEKNEELREVKLDSLRLAIVKSSLEIITRTENMNHINNLGDDITLIAEIANKSGKEEDIDLYIEMPREVYVREIIVPLSGGGYIKKSINDKIIRESGSVKIGETAKVEINGQITDLQFESDREKTKTIEVKGTINGEEIKWEFIVANPYYEENKPEVTPVPTTTPETTPETTPNKQDEETYYIAGMVWLDENESGIKEVNEQNLNGISVKLLNIETKEIEKEVTTNKDGKYEFEGVKSGIYQVIFEYDETKYELTEYRKTKTNEVNSSVVAGKEKGQAISNTITINDKDEQHVNMGLKKVYKFDMKVEQTINKMIIQNPAEGTREISYNNAYAKTDIKSKYINNTVVLVVYNIKVKNEGDIEGKVKEIVDYMPRDMVFSSDLNPTWMQDSNGNLYNRELKDIDIKPGETKEITLTLKKTMTENNVGLSHNVVELSKVENAANIKDKDSIPGNKVQGEDDMAETDVLISISTGEEVVYVTLGIVAGIMITTGIYMIKRKVLNYKNKEMGN